MDHWFWTDFLAWANVVPLVVLAVLVFAVHWSSRDGMFVAIAMALVFVFAQFDYLLIEGSNWWMHLVYPPLQLALIMAAVMPEARGAHVATSVIVLLSLIATIGATGAPQRPEMVIEVGSYAFVTFIALPRTTWSLRPGVLAYFGASVPFLLVQGFTTPEPENPNTVFWVAYYGEQAARLVGAVLVSLALWRAGTGQVRT